MEFKDIGLSENIIKALSLQKITKPTDVQEKAIPTILSGKDAIIQSETGSGKTLAYLLPLYAKQKAEIEKGLQMLILVPTHELALQVHRQIEQLSEKSGTDLKSAVIIGKVNIKGQIEKLKQKPQIVVGTCDRIFELIKKKKITAHTVKTLVVDEADKMLEKQSLNAVKDIRKTLMRDTQCVFVSASITEKVSTEASLLSHEPVFVKTTQSFNIPEGIEHMCIVCEKRDKLEVLRKLVGIMNPERAIVFINGTEDIETAFEKLKYHKIECACIHGESDKSERQRAIEGFANGKIKLLIATDIASRGLDIDNVDTVFSVSISDDPMDYLHRSGRTGRSGNSGVSVCIASENELKFLQKYENKFGIKINPVKMRNGEIIPIKK